MTFQKKTQTPSSTSSTVASTAREKPKRIRTPLPTWEPPEDFKAFYSDLYLRTDKDGLLCAKNIKMNRYVSEKSKEDLTKVWDMLEDDPMTVMGVLARFSAATYKTNPAQRLSPNTTYKLLLRVGATKAKTKDNAKNEGDNTNNINNEEGTDNQQPSVLKCVVKRVSVLTVKKVKVNNVIKKKVVAVSLDAKDPAVKKFKSASKILGSAFQNVLAPRKRTREENKALREKASSKALR